MLPPSLMALFIYVMGRYVRAQKIMLHTFLSNTQSWINSFGQQRQRCDSKSRWHTTDMSQICWAISFCNLWQTMLTTKELHYDECPQLLKECKNEWLCWCKTNNWICKVEFYTSHKFISGLRLYMKTSQQFVQVCVQICQTQQYITHSVLYVPTIQNATQHRICVHKPSIWMKIGWILLTIIFVLGGFEVRQCKIAKLPWHHNFELCI